MSYPPPGDPNQQPSQYPAGQPQQPYAGPPSGYPSDPGGYGYGSGGYAAHMERPGVVTAGSIIAIVLSGLSALTAAGVMIGAIVAWDSMIDEFRSNPDRYDLDTSQINDIADAQPAVVVFAIIWLAIAVFGVFLAMMTIKGQNWARITLVVFAGLTALISLLLITSIVSAVWLIGAIACIICVFVGGANDWFRYRKQLRQQPY